MKRANRSALQIRLLCSFAFLAGLRLCNSFHNAADVTGYKPISLEGQERKTGDGLDIAKSLKDEPEEDELRSISGPNHLATEQLPTEKELWKSQTKAAELMIERFEDKFKKRVRRANKEAAGHDQTSHEHDKDDGHHNHHDSHAWKYYGAYGPSNWSHVAPHCSTDRPRQTPINIRTSLTKVDETMPDLTLVVTERQPHQAVTLTNNGHSVNVAFDNMMRVSGGKLGSIFRVAGVHFHWGLTDYTGSEHTINGERFPLEMHIVSYDEGRFSGITAETLNSSNSLAVLGVLFTISENDNPALEHIVSNLMSIQTPGESIRVPYFDLRTLLPKKYSTHFYRYMGSLTTPPCSEVVIWTIFQNHLTISSSQLEYFRQLYEEKNTKGKIKYLKYNWRPIQPLHGRDVIRSFLHVHSIESTKTSKVTPPIVDLDVAPAVGQEPKCPSSSSALVINVHLVTQFCVAVLSLFVSNFGQM